MSNVTEVVGFDIVTDRDDFAVDVTIKLRRHPEGIRYFGAEPTSSDLPVDFMLALMKWLAVSEPEPKDKNIEVGSNHGDAK